MDWSKIIVDLVLESLSKVISKLILIWFGASNRKRSQTKDILPDRPNKIEKHKRRQTCKLDTSKTN